MPDAMSALPGASYSGTIDVANSGLTGMVTIRGNLTDKGFAEAVGKVLGLGLPEPRRISVGSGESLLWMSPDELLLVCAHDDAEEKVKALGESLNGLHHLVVNASDARAVFRLTGEGSVVRDLLARLSPADLRASALPEGEVRRTRLAQVPAAFWFDTEGATVVAFRSVAQYAFDLLKSAASPGTEIGYHQGSPHK